jgi:hypothetical protein
MALTLILAGAVLLPAPGCGLSVTGQWRLVKAIPSREVFAIDEAQFARDGTFAATVTIEGKTAREKGTYEFNGFKLTLRPQAGGQRRYDAVERFGKLEVIDGERKVILEKTRKHKETEASEQGARK